MRTERERDIRKAGLQFGILTILCLLAFRADFGPFAGMLRDPDSAHGLVAPLVIAALAITRREAIVSRLSRGSPWGAVLVVAAIGMYFLSTWPFNYHYPRRAAIVPALAGIVVAVGGWRVLKPCLPMLLILLLAIPTGTRTYAALIIKPETWTLGAARAILDLLPGVFVELRGPDLSYVGARGAGTIALGEHHRGAGLFFAYATLGAFVTFARIRPWWQLLGMALAAPLIILGCNLARLVLWGLTTIYNSFGPLSPVPRLVSSALALLLAYGLFVAAAVALSKIVVPSAGADQVKGAEPPAPAGSGGQG